MISKGKDIEKNYEEQSFGLSGVNLNIPYNESNEFKSQNKKQEPHDEQKENQNQNVKMNFEQPKQEKTAEEQARAVELQHQAEKLVGLKNN